MSSNVRVTNGTKYRTAFLLVSFSPLDVVAMPFSFALVTPANKSIAIATKIAAVQSVMRMMCRYK